MMVMWIMVRIRGMMPMMVVVVAMMYDDMNTAMVMMVRMTMNNSRRIMCMIMVIVMRWAMWECGYYHTGVNSNTGDNVDLCDDDGDGGNSDDDTHDVFVYYRSIRVMCVRVVVITMGMRRMGTMMVRMVMLILVYCRVYV